MLEHMHRRQDRWLLIVAAMAFGGAVSLAIASIATQIGQPTPGFVTWENLVVPAVSTTSAAPASAQVPLRAIVVAVDGEPVTTAQELRRHLSTLPEGTQVEYTFRHGDHLERITLPTRILRWPEVLPFAAPYLLNGIVLVVTSLVVFSFRPRLPAARAFLSLGLIFGGMIVLALDAFSAYWLNRLCYALDSFVPGALLHFALCFPEERPIVRRRPRLLWWVYLPSAILALLQNYFLTRSASSHLAVSDWVYAADAAAALAAVASFVHVFTRSRNVVARRQAKAVATGFGLAAFVPALAILAVVLLGADIPFNPLTLFLLVCPISIGYAIGRHNLFEVDRFLRTGVVYGALSLLVFVVYAGLMLVGESWMGDGQPLPAEVASLYILAVLLVANPLRMRVQDAVDRLFYRQSYSYRSAVEETSRSLTTLLGTQAIAEAVLRVLTEVMTIDWGALMVFGEARSRGEVFLRPEGRDTAIGPQLMAQRGALLPLAQTPRPRMVQELVAREQTDPAWALLERLTAVLVVPLRFQGKPVGLLVVGEKKSGAFYSDDDVHLLETLAHQAALALVNAQAFEELARAQESLVRAERLAAVGELAATVAHGIRNPLAGIRMAAQVANEDRDDTQALAESLADILSETDRLEQRVRALLDFTRPFEPRIEPVELGAFVHDFVEQLRRRLPETIELRSDVAAEPLVSQLDRSHLHEVVEAIVLNAAEAMRERGTITLGLQRSEAGDQAALTITDDGPGIEAAVLPRVFDLFFTTKSSGTGIGLAMAKRLIERLGGHVAVASERGRGTSFTLRLPL